MALGAHLPHLARVANRRWECAWHDLQGGGKPTVVPCMQGPHLALRWAYIRQVIIASAGNARTPARARSPAEACQRLKKAPNGAAVQNIMGA